MWAPLLSDCSSGQEVAAAPDYGPLRLGLVVATIDALIHRQRSTSIRLVESVLLVPARTIAEDLGETWDSVWHWADVEGAALHDLVTDDSFRTLQLAAPLELNQQQIRHCRRPKGLPV
jgi:hypothetical protein